MPGLSILLLKRSWEEDKEEICTIQKHICWGKKKNLKKQGMQLRLRISPGKQGWDTEVKSDHTPYLLSIS